MYCTVDDIRAAGISADSHDNDAVNAAISVAVEFIDRTTRQWFEARDASIDLTGPGRANLRLPVPPIGDPISVTVDDDVLDSDYYKVFMPTVPDCRMSPKLRYIGGVWREGSEIVVVGSFGYVDDPGDTKTTPILIKRAVIKLTMKMLKPLATSVADEASIVSESHGDYSYRLRENAAQGFYGDSEIDDILARFTRIRMEAV